MRSPRERMYINKRRHSNIWKCDLKKKISFFNGGPSKETSKEKKQCGITKAQ